MGKKKAKDHYVSRTYLKYFLNEGDKTWVYDKVRGKVKERGRAEICWKGNGSNNRYLDKERIVEEYLKYFENRWNDALKVFFSQSEVTFEEYLEAKYIISGYVAYLRFGTPASIRAGAKSLEPILYNAFEVLSRQGKLPTPPKELEHLFGNIRKNFQFNVDEKFAQALGISAMLDACDVFYKSLWAIFDNSTKLPFLTSDNPTCIWKPAESSTDMIYVPLAPTLAILIKPVKEKANQIEFSMGDGARFFANDEFVSEINETVVKNSEQYVISNIQAQSILDLVGRFKDWKYECQTTEIPTGNGKFIISRFGSRLSK